MCALVDDAKAQGPGRKPVNPPVISSVFPPGGTVGTSVQWTLNGRGLSKIRQLMISGSGIKTTSFEARGENQAVATVAIDANADPGYRELRVEGADGVSNLLLARIDTVKQVVEVEPNNRPSEAQVVPIETAVAAVIAAADVDYYRVEGPPGTTVTFDLEARRVGTSISPVLTATKPNGAAISQARESRSNDRDARLGVTIPREGAVIVQVRDNTYSGNDLAGYRLRVTRQPYATGLFPLGGPPGKPVEVTISGGNLKKPLTKTVTLPNTPGVRIDPGLFASPDGPVPSPNLITVGNSAESELVEPATASAERTIALGQTMNGRISARDEVDRYTVTVKKGQKFRVSASAAAIGSWLDTVLTLKDESGATVAENDDQGDGGTGRVNVMGLSGGSTDSELEYEATKDMKLAIELTDRYGEGGPEYGYRLSVGVSRPNFEVKLLIGNPNSNGQIATAASRMTQSTPGLFGVFNVAPGTRIPISFIVIPQGRPGPVTLSVEGLPEGVTVEPLKVDVLGPGDKGGSPRIVNAVARADNLALSVASYASPGLGELRVVGTAEIEPGVLIKRTASAVIGLESVGSTIPAPPITRTITSLPLRVIGENRFRLVGPPEPPKLIGVRVPGVLLAGDRLDLGLDFDVSPLADPGFTFDAKAEGVGLATNTVILSGASVPDSESENPGDVIVRVLASPKAVPGVYPVTISYALSGGKPITQVVFVIVRSPLKDILLRDEPIELAPGESKSVWVEVRRQLGADVEIDFKLEGAPRGVKLAPVSLKEQDTETMLTLEASADARITTKPVPMRIIAIARMPRGAVAIESRIRPMISVRTAEEKGRGRIE